MRGKMRRTRSWAMPRSLVYLGVFVVIVSEGVLCGASATTRDTHSTSSGVTYVVTKPGSGRQPKLGQVVCVRLNSFGSNGVLFQKNRENGDLLGIGLVDESHYPSALREVLINLHIGDQAVILAPASQVTAGIGLGSTVIYVVDVVDIKDRELLKTMSGILAEKGAGAALKEYLSLKQENYPNTYVSEWESNAFGYALMKEGAYAEAISVFRSNLQAYPGSANAYDSLGDAYEKVGDKPQAIECYRKAVALDPLFVESLIKLDNLGAFPLFPSSIAAVTTENSAKRTNLYSYLAQRSFQAFDNGDKARAAEIATRLERVWDRREEKGDESLQKKNPALFQQIDRAMDEFIGLITHYQTSEPDPGRVQSAYVAYLEKLKAAN
jgi:tetratricopeptide (TPR) repeat protein